MRIAPCVLSPPLELMLLLQWCLLLQPWRQSRCSPLLQAWMGVGAAFSSLIEARFLVRHALGPLYVLTPPIPGSTIKFSASVYRTHNFICNKDPHIARAQHRKNWGKNIARAHNTKKNREKGWSFITSVRLKPTTAAACATRWSRSPLLRRGRCLVLHKHSHRIHKQSRRSGARGGDALIDSGRRWTGARAAEALRGGGIGASGAGGGGASGTAGGGCWKYALEAIIEMIIFHYVHDIG